MAEKHTQDNSPPLTAFALGMMALVGLLRLLPHLLPIPYPWNAAPAGALSLYGGARLGFWTALTVPLLLMAGTDLLIWSLRGWSPFDYWVYASLLVSVLMGRLLVNTKSPWRIGACTVLAATQFFLVTNFGVWIASRIDPNEVPPGAGMIRVSSQYPDGDVKYASNLQGLATCYVMGAKFSPPAAPYGFALPMFVSDVLFTGLLFGAHSWVSRRNGRGVLAGWKQAEVAT
jgi:hypothetical protein